MPDEPISDAEIDALAEARWTVDHPGGPPYSSLQPANLERALYRNGARTTLHEVREGHFNGGGNGGITVGTKFKTDAVVTDVEPPV